LETFVNKYEKFDHIYLFQKARRVLRTTLFYNQSTILKHCEQLPYEILKVKRKKRAYKSKKKFSNKKNSG